MSFDTNYCPSCGCSGGCSCNSCSGGYEYSTCSPDYNPVTVNNSTCPTVEGSQGTGGNASGNNSSVHVSVCGTGTNADDDCCCKNGLRKLLEYLYLKSVDTTLQTSTLCMYGNIIPSNIEADAVCTDALLGLDSNAKIQATSITDDLVKYDKYRVSICSISALKFTFASPGDNTADLRKNFFYTPKCKCCCDCGDGMAQALYLNGLGISTYEITLQDTLLKDSPFSVVPGTISGLTLIAVDSDIAIFWATGNIYFGIPTCKIAKFSA